MMKLLQIDVDDAASHTSLEMVDIGCAAEKIFVWENSHDHPADECSNTPHCINCDGGHPSYSRACPAWKREKDIISLKVRENISFKEARRRFSIVSHRTYADAALKGAVRQQLPVAVRTPDIGATTRPPAPTAGVASSTPPPKKDQQASGSTVQKTSPSEERPKPNAQTRSARSSSVSEETMDITQGPSALPPKGRQNSLERLPRGKLKSQADRLGEHFQHISSSEHYSRAFLSHKTTVESCHFRPQKPTEGGYNSPITMHELNVALKSSGNSAPGADEITYEMIRRLPRETLECLLGLYNKILSTGHMPHSWKEAIVIPILKQGKDASDVCNYEALETHSDVQCGWLAFWLARRLAGWVSECLGVVAILGIG
ncbi:uncharacterized protein LOC119385353 [Rhipicephalus sanguineus]|uniref:uncharacterized protein LOC119385353 n=1 Tax=Rhipicephalus sanguineus TaxID=34632 RepID=UPI0018960CED|nr:uncharacterized protein LOC119385353 [Rhipicephalus sanguineus]